MTREGHDAVTATNDMQPQIDQALGILQGFLASAGLDATAVLESQEGETVTFAIQGPDSGLMVGMHGSVLNALQYLLQLSVNKSRDQRLRIMVDADRYRIRRAARLTEFAQELAAQVAASGEEAMTDSLSPLDRRTIHSALADHPAVQTYSEGVEPDRYVVISPRTE